MARLAPHQPGIREMAKELSLSVCTISKAINGRPGVGDDTRRRILKAASAIDYVPNRQAQMLRQGRSRCIGLLLPTLTNPVYSERMEGIHQAAADHGYEVLVTSFERDPRQKTRLCREMIGRRMEAVILPGGLDQVPLRSFIDAKIAVLLVSPGAEAIAGAAVLRVNRSEGVRQLFGHLLRHGHRRPLLVGNWAGDAERMAGLGEALRENGLPEDEFLVGAENSIYEIMEHAYEQTLEAFGADRHAATAIMASNDLGAIGAIAALDRLGLSAPADVSVTGMDNIAAARFSRPPLTTVSQTHLHLGRRAVEMVVSILEEKAAPDVRQEFAPELVVRKSTGPAAVAGVRALPRSAGGVVEAAARSASAPTKEKPQSIAAKATNHFSERSLSCLV